MIKLIKKLEKKVKVSDVILDWFRVDLEFIMLK